MIRRGFKAELYWFLLYISVAGLIGYLSGFFLFALLAALGLYVTWTFRQIYALEKWILRTRRRSMPDNDLAGVWGDIADDVTLMHNRFEKENQRLQAVVTRVQDMTAALTDAVVVTNHDGIIEWWNGAAERLLGFQSMDRRHAITNLIRHPRFVSYFETADYEEPLTLSDLRRQQQHLEFQVHVFAEGDRLIVVRDVTGLFKLEQMRKDFVANVSHELRTPLTVIRGYVEALAGTEAVPPVWDKALRHIQQQSVRMASLIDDLITLTRLETDLREPKQDTVALAPLFSTIVSEAQAVSGDRKHRFSVEGAEGLALTGTARELRSAFSNLIINAVNYSPPASDIRVLCREDRLGISVTVSDNGPGIDPKHIPRLTERFYRVDSGRSVATGGTGLGLAIVKHILLRHDAELKITSTLGKGSHFTCHFPHHRVAPQQALAQNH